MINEELYENTDGPDVIKARRALQQANRAKEKTDNLVTEANAALASLRRMHEENHFVDKLRFIIRGVP